MYSLKDYRVSGICAIFIAIYKLYMIFVWYFICLACFNFHKFGAFNGLVRFRLITFTYIASYASKFQVFLRDPAGVLGMPLLRYCAKCKYSRMNLWIHKLIFIFVFLYFVTGQFNWLSHKNINITVFLVVLSIKSRGLFWIPFFYQKSLKILHAMLRVTSNSP